MIELYIRRPYQNLLVDPLANQLSRFTFNPNAITFLSFLIGMMVCPLLYYGKNYIALLTMLISGYLDSLDGAYARATKHSTSKGAVFDIVSDRVVEFCIITGLYLNHPDERGLLALIMLGASYICVTSFLVVGIFIPNSCEKSFHYSPGLIERGEAFILYALMIAFPIAFMPLAIIYSLLVVLTAVIRIFEFATQNNC